MAEGATSAVADATVLMLLPEIGRLEDLWRRYDRVLVPAPIHEEVVRQGKRLEHPDAVAVEAALDRGEIELAGPVDVVDPRVDVAHGDRAVLALALAEDVGTVLTDDGGLRGLARSHRLTPRGTLAFPVQALEDGEIGFEAYLEELEALVENGLRVSPELYARAVRRGREIAAEA